MKLMGKRWRALLVLLISVSLFSFVNPGRTEESDYLMELDLFPAEHRLEGSLKARVSREEVRGSMHPDLVIDSLTDEKGRDIRYERNDWHLTLYPEGSEEINIKFHGEPHDETWNREMVGEYTQIFMEDVLQLSTMPQKPTFLISVPESFIVLKLRERVFDVRMEGNTAIGSTRYIGGGDPSLVIRGGRAEYAFRTTENNIAFISAEYVSSRATENGIDYGVYLFPEHKGMLNDNMDLAQEIIEFYSERYYSYPLSEFRVVEAEVETDYANDRYSTSLITFGDGDKMAELFPGSYVEPEKSVKEYLNTAKVVVHETSHFWFGNLITAGSALDEGLATFSEFAFAENFDPKLSRELRKYYVQLMTKPVTGRTSH